MVYLVCNIDVVSSNYACRVCFSAEEKQLQNSWKAQFNRRQEILIKGNGKLHPMTSEAAMESGAKVQRAKAVYAANSGVYGAKKRYD